MYTQMFYIVLALLFAISQLGIPKVLFLIGCLRWGEFWTEIIACYSLLRSLNPELLKNQPQEAILTIDSLPDDDLTAKDDKLVAPEPVLEPKDIISAEVSPFKEQLETEEKKSVQFDTKVEKPKEIPEIEQQLETGQNNPELKNNQTQEAILTIDSKLFDDNPEPPVSEPVIDNPTDIPVDFNTDFNTDYNSEVIIPPSNEPLEMLDEKVPESLSILPEPIVDSTGNVTNNDPVGETQLDEIAKETIIPEENERAEEQPEEAQSNKITDDKQLIDDEIRRVNRESRPPTERDIIDEVSALSKMMVPDEEMIVPEESEHVEEQPIAEAQYMSTADGNQLTDEDSVNRQSPLLTEEEIDDEATGSSKLMTPDEQMEENQEEEKEEEKEEEEKEEEVKENEGDEGGEVGEGGEGGEGEEEEEEDEEDEDLLTGNENPIEVVNTPKLVEMKVVRGANFPKAKDSDQYYLSVLVEEWHRKIIKVKKSSIFGLKKSTVGFVKMAVSDLMHEENSQVSALKMQLNDKSNNPVGEAYLEVDMKISDLPEVVPSPAEVKKQERKLKAQKIMKSQEILKPDGPKSVSGSTVVSQIETDEIKPEIPYPENIAETRNVPNEESDVVTKSKKKLVAPEPVSDPVDIIPAEETPLKEQLETDEKNPVQVDTKVEKPKEIQLEKEQQLETGQNNPKLNNNQTQEAILTINGSLSSDNPEPVSDPVDIPAEVKIPPSNEPLEMLDEKEPESLSILPEIIVDSTGNVTNKDPVGETQLDEIAKETIVPDEEIEHVEEQPAADEAQSKSTAESLTEREIDDEAPGLSKLMTPEEQMEEKQEEEKEVKEEEEKEEEKENEEEEDEGGEEEEEDEDLLTGNENPIKVVNTPKLVEMKVLRGVNFPEAKDSDQYYLSVLVEEWHRKICYQNQTKEFKSKTIRDRWNKNFTIQTQHPESCLMTIKVKKSSIFGLKKSTVGFVKMAVSDLMHDENGHVSALKMQLNDESNNPVGEAYLELDMKVGDLPELVPSPAEVKRQERKLKAHQILYQRHEVTLMEAAKKRQERMLMNVPNSVSGWRKMKRFLVKYEFLLPDKSYTSRQYKSTRS